MYHGDEAAHSGIHRWKLSGLNTISEQVITMPFPSAYAPPIADYIDLMIGLPWYDTLENNTAGWTRDSDVDYNNSSSDKFNVSVSKQSYKEGKENDITASFQSTTIRTNTVTRDLGSNNVTSNWKITGLLCYPAGNNANGSFAKQFLEVLDANGKILTT